MDENQRPETFFTLLRRWIRGEPSGDLAVNFTPRAQQILALARKAAIDRGHPELTADHVFLGILLLNRGVAIAVLCRLGCDLQTLRAEMEAGLNQWPKEPSANPLKHAPETKVLLAEAVRQARALSHVYVGSEHLLLGLLAGEGSRSGQLLKALGLNLQLVTTEVLRELDPNSTSEDRGEEKAKA